jgi:pilus assembly protein CpaB
MLRIALLIFALAAGGAAAWVVVLVRSEPGPVTTIIEPATPVPVQDVLVASADLGPGHTLAKEDMRWQSWPESALNPAYVRRSARPDALETLAGSKANSPIISGQPIRDENLRPLNPGSPSAMRLERGKRAVAVVISAQNFGGGLIQQYDRVDVILTVVPTTAATNTTQTQSATTTTTKSRTSNEEQTVLSRTILRNVPVLAIDMATEPTVDQRSKDDKGKAEKGNAKEFFSSRTATLELDPSQVEILVRGEQSGKLWLALRSTADNGEKPPKTESSLSVTSSMVGGSKFIHITTSNTPVEVTAQTTPLGPAWAPPQEALPGEQQQVQQGDTGSAIR